MVGLAGAARAGMAGVVIRQVVAVDTQLKKGLVLV
jgi:hypothetical protein